MNKLIKYLLVTSLLCGLMLLTSIHRAKAVIPQYLSLFSGNAQMLYLSNNITITNGSPGVAASALTTANATNYWYIGGLQYTNVLAGSNYNFVTNTYVGQTNFQTIPQMFGAVDLWSDLNGDVTTPVFSFTINNTNVYLPGSDNNIGIPPTTNLPVLIFVPAVTSTNAVTVNFIRGVGPRSNVQWDRLNLFSCTVSNTGIGPTTILTNPPSAWVQGATKVAVFSVSSIASTGPGNIISAIGISGFIP